MRNIIANFMVIVLILMTSGTALAVLDGDQGKVETRVGNPQDNPNPGDDGLKPGEFRPPFKCGLSYVSTTYPGGSHLTYAVDFNRAPYGAEDRGDPIRAAADGKVVWKDLRCGTIGLSHEGGYESWYVHMRNINVRLNDRVGLGQKLGEISDTAINREGECSAQGPHLHTHHKRNGNYIKLAYKNNRGVIEPNPWSQLNPRDFYQGKYPAVSGQCP
jgi:murein DD-endopeptidase MepM/ murein hydrolase activator NlpD